ncbi:MAG TPA: hypothetical protein VN033_13595 [Vulgatibacter sp.]|nr:hypothetical protein [Vulgatibacter sp.]
MELDRTGWLGEFFDILLAEYRPERAYARLSAVARGEGSAEALPAKVRVLRHLDEELRRSGLLYGSPKLPSRMTLGRRLDRAHTLFLSVLAGECFVALDVGRILGIPYRREHAEVVLTIALAVAVGRVDLATAASRHLGPPRRAAGSRILESLASLPALAVPELEASLPRIQERIEAELVGRVGIATGDSMFDLPVHNGLVFGDVRVIARVASDLHRHGRFRPEFARRVYEAATRERARLLPGLVALIRLQRPLSDVERRVVIRELRRLKVPRELSRRVRDAIDAGVTPSELARQIRTRSARRFALEQAWLAALIGDAGGVEERFVAELAEAFDFTPDDLAAIEAEAADYFFDPEDVIDAFEIRAKGQGATEKLVDRIEREITENIDKIAIEVKETGELTQLLAKAAVGQKLTPQERQKAREQLLDLAKVVPSLAIIAAPGGMLIFAALLKVLPFSLLPSAFQQRPSAPARRRPTRRPTRTRKGG